MLLSDSFAVGNGFKKLEHCYNILLVELFSEVCTCWNSRGTLQKTIRHVTIQHAKGFHSWSVIHVRLISRTTLTTSSVRAHLSWRTAFIFLPVVTTTRFSFMVYRLTSKLCQMVQLIRKYFSNHLYIRYPHNVNTTVLTILSLLKRSKLHPSDTNDNGVGIFAPDVYSQLTHSADSVDQLNNKKHWHIM